MNLSNNYLSEPAAKSPCGGRRAACRGGASGRSRVGAANRRCGFTLIELLTAIAILSIMVVMVARIFKDGTRIWELGTGRAVTSLNGRAALNLIEHDLQYAVADDVLTFMMRPDGRYPSAPSLCFGRPDFGVTNSEICFVSLQHDSSGYAERTAREIHYWVESNVLYRGYFSEAINDNPGKHCYSNQNWYLRDTVAEGGAGRPTNFCTAPVAENVTAFKVYAATNNGGYVTTYWSSNNWSCLITNAFGVVPFGTLPEYVDVLVELVQDIDSERAATIMTPTSAPNVAAAKAYIERKARRFTTRVYFQNKLGYRKR